MAQNLVSGQYWAGCRVDVSVPSYLVNDGFTAAPTANSTGNTTCTLVNGVDATENVLCATLDGAAAGLLTVASTSDTAKTVITWSITVGADADTALADLDFFLAIFRKMG